MATVPARAFLLPLLHLWGGGRFGKWCQHRTRRTNPSKFHQQIPSAILCPFSSARMSIVLCMNSAAPWPALPPHFPPGKAKADLALAMTHAMHANKVQELQQQIAQAVQGPPVPFIVVLQHLATPPRPCHHAASCLGLGGGVPPWATSPPLWVYANPGTRPLLCRCGPVAPVLPQTRSQRGRLRS